MQYHNEYPKVVYGHIECFPTPYARYAPVFYVEHFAGDVGSARLLISEQLYYSVACHESVLFARGG
jgi:hypothetical protein